MIETSHHEIRPLDILCGKDKSLRSHPGNRLFRKIIEETKPSYRNASDKLTKMKITKGVLDCLRKNHGCRFVKFDPDLTEWAELTPAQMRDKIGHALRFALRRSNHRSQSSESSLDSSGSASSVTKKRTTMRRLPKVVSIPYQAEAKQTTGVSKTFSVISTNSQSLTTTGKGEAFQAGEEIHAGLSISMERIQRARHDVDQIIQRQNEFLQALTMKLSVNVPLPAAETGMISSQSRSALSQPIDLDCQSRSGLSQPVDLDYANIFRTSGELDFQMAEAEAL